MVHLLSSAVARSAHLQLSLNFAQVTSVFFYTTRKEACAQVCGIEGVELAIEIRESVCRSERETEKGEAEGERSKA